ncbi:hypothetical protein GOP47_0000035 [Adiantum capillus-veneris]|uniref:Uncharacterized protein n=1 Tax=Adiantum capillus-veneris TaxID=13818 RepID=A0A9D4VC99_ADICA|nr:hypothetical protein GOP47_0000035 [Adiantum capillus-veneris]
MAEDRKKVLEALAAKRKAEAAGGGRSTHKQKSSPLLSKPASAQSSPLPHKPNSKPSPLMQKHKQEHHKQQHHKKETPPKKKKKRVETYDTEDDEDEDQDESGEDSDSEEEPVKKKVPSTKGGSAAKAPSLKPSLIKGHPESKGKVSLKESVKGKRKSKDSSDDDVGSGDEDEEGAEADSGDEGLDTSNILPGRSRRSQPVHYDFTNMSGDDDDDSD